MISSSNPLLVPSAYHQPNCPCHIAESHSFSELFSPEGNDAHVMAIEPRIGPAVVRVTPDTESMCFSPTVTVTTTESTHCLPRTEPQHLVKSDISSSNFEINDAPITNSSHVVVTSQNRREPNTCVSVTEVMAEKQFWRRKASSLQQELWKVCPDRRLDQQQLEIERLRSANALLKRRLETVLEKVRVDDSDDLHIRCAYYVVVIVLR